MSANKMQPVTNNTIPMKARDIHPLAVRINPAMREKLAREAAINGHSLHAEILGRLAASFAENQRDVNTQAGHVARENPASWPVPPSDAERALISIYKRLSPEKQLALLSLLK